jgi:type I restriction enzyme S subunit
MSEWKEYRFSELLVDDSISYGIVQPGFHKEDGIPIIRVNNIKNGKIATEDVLKVSSDVENKYNRTRLEGGELLITVVGTVGECAIVPKELKAWNVARAVSVARIKEGIEKQYIRYAFKTDDIIFQMYGNTNDTVQPTLNLSSLKELKFSLPPLPEQTAIAEVLSSLDDKIDLLQRQNKTLEQLAETLFRQWFVEEVEESWDECTLEQLATFHNGKSRPDEVGDIPIYGGNGILGYTNKSNYSGRSIIIGRVGAYCGSLFFEENDIWVSDNALLAKPVNDVYTHYLFYLLKSIDLNSMAEGSSHPLLTQTLLKSIEVLTPPTKKVVYFETQLIEFNKKIKSNTQQIRALIQLRDTLLPKLMSGEVRVDK